jgi:hypothetical protein
LTPVVRNLGKIVYFLSIFLLDPAQRLKLALPAAALDKASQKLVIHLFCEPDPHLDGAAVAAGLRGKPYRWSKAMTLR